MGLWLMPRSFFSSGHSVDRNKRRPLMVERSDKTILQLLPLSIARYPTVSGQSIPL